MVIFQLFPFKCISISLSRGGVIFTHPKYSFDTLCTIKLLISYVTHFILLTKKLLTEHHLEFLGLKGGCTGSSEFTLVKIPHCLESHVAAH